MFNIEKVARGGSVLLLLTLFMTLFAILFCPRPVWAGENGGATLKLLDSSGEEAKVTVALIKEEGFKIQITLKSEGVSWNKSLEKDWLKYLGSMFETEDDAILLEQLDKIEAAFKNAARNLFKIEDGHKILTITIPKIEDYFLSRDQNITLVMPGRFVRGLEGEDAIKFGFTIESEIKALLYYEIEANISAGMRIVIELNGAKWAEDLETNGVKQRVFINAFEARSETEEWDKVKKVMNDAVDGNENLFVIDKVTNKLAIIIPQTEGYSPREDQNIILTIPSEMFTGWPKGTNLVIKFTVKAIPRAVLLKNKFMENDIAAGRCDIAIKLIKAEWADDLETNQYKQKDFIATFTADQQQDEWEKVKTALINAVEQGGTANPFKIRGNNDILEIIIPETPDYLLEGDQNVTFTLDTERMLAKKKMVELPASVAKVTIGAIPKAILSSTEYLDSDIVGGGKYFKITLINAYWNENLKTDVGLKNRLIDLLQPGTRVGNWVDFLNIIKARGTISIGTGEKNKELIIGFPPAPKFEIMDIVEIRLLNAEQINLLAGAFLALPDGKPTTVPIPTFGAATIKPTAGKEVIIIPSVLNVNTIRAGEAKVVLELSSELGEARWKEDLPDNTKAKNDLIKGFTVQDQQNEWKLVSKALSDAKGWISHIDGEGKRLTISIPPIPEYAIIRDQKVQITIPKTALQDGKNNIQAGILTIKVPGVGDIDSLPSIEDLLKEEYILNGRRVGLMEYIEGTDLSDISVTVPPRYVETIIINTVEVEENTITTVEVLTAPGVEKVAVYQGERETETDKKESPFIFVFQDLELNSDLKVKVFEVVYENAAKVDRALQSEISRKVTKGNKTYNELPKKRLDGIYSLYLLLTDKSLFKDILKEYMPGELVVSKPSSR